MPDPAEILDEAAETLTQWAEVAEAAWRNGDDIAAALDARFGRPPEHHHIAPEVWERLDTLNGIHSNAAGFQRWLDVRASTGKHSNGVQVHHHPHD